jgi:hypothetical protein
MSVFSIVDGAINGSVFQLSAAQRDRIPDGLCHLIHRVVRCGEVLLNDGIQLSFFNVSFNVLRTETISAIYERFVSIEDTEGKRDDGVFYTPPHLVDHVLDRVEEILPITRESKIIDPAAGSGIFLVGAYRRLLERHAPENGWSPKEIGRAKSLLLECIHGVEKHPQAANVCRFSLYLTLLDYVGRASITELVAAAGDTKFLPDLSRNIISANAFEQEVFLKKYSHVVGNPPWSMTGGQKDRRNQNDTRREDNSFIVAFANELKKKRRSFGQNRLSDLFMWLAAERLATSDGVIAFLLPAHSVIGRLAGGFAHSLALHTTVKWIGNLSHLRRKLFVGVEAPACVVIALNHPPTDMDRAAVYRPLLSSLPGGKKSEVWSLLGSQVDVQHQRSRDLQDGSNGWFTQTMLSGFDRRMHEALKVWTKMNRLTLGDFLDRSNLVISKGGSPTETGIDRKLGKDSSGKEKTAQILSLTRDDLIKVSPDFRGFYSGNVILIPRSMNAAKYHRHPVAYPSTFNAIITKKQYEDSLQGPIPEADFVYFDTRFIDGFLKYIDSNVVQYFASLFGASYLMDKARLEKKDLLAFPCPFDDIDDPKLLELSSSDSPDDLILEAMNAGSDFKAAFAEFSVFRRYFANAQTPPDSLMLVSEISRSLYLNRLIAEIRSSLDRDRKIDASIDFSNDRQTYVTISFGEERQKSPPEIDVTGQFLGSSIVNFDKKSNTALIIKSPTRYAWTIDQAVTDAATLRREIRSIH